MPVIKLSRVHYCFSQHLNESKPRTCRCRKKVPLLEATKLVERGLAQWIVLSTKYLTGKEPCPMCLNTAAKKNCQHCGKTGEVEKTYPIRKHGDDIVLVSVGSEGKDGKTTYRSVLALKTPRVATVEKSHIERAYVDGNKDEIERIEAYGLMILEARIEMGIKPEPPDDPTTGAGRNFDWGRTPFARIADERTNQGGVGKRIAEGFKMTDDEKREDGRS
jgi:hypothetical protein